MLQSGSPPGVWSVQRAACLQPFCVPSSSFTLAFLRYSSSNSGERSIEAPEFLCFVGIASRGRGVGSAEKGTLTFLRSARANEAVLDYDGPIIMSDKSTPAEYLVICRGQWDKAASQGEIQNVIDQFYTWLDRLVDEGKMKRGQRLTNEGKTVGRRNVVTDGPFGESKEVIGGFWFAVANSLDEAAQIAAGNPCLDYGLSLEIRPIDPDIATADNTN